MRPYSSGRLNLNFLSANEDDHQVVSDGVRRETYEKLAKIKTKYDPTNFFDCPCPRQRSPRAPGVIGVRR
jgi:hypothetical protein